MNLGLEKDSTFRIRVVRMILDGQPEEALRSLATHYEVEEPELRVGTVKRHRKVLAVYVHKERRIYISKSDLLRNPFVILHEFYHHLRASQAPRNNQVEKRADSFASAYIRTFQQFSRDSLKPEVDRRPS
jgi:hypothetical protein